MAKLLRVVLIDSLCPGDLVEVKVDENTCLTGTNGIGKSTFLKLIPLFFGAAAGRMVKGGVNTLKFADHYLPNASSYIVYEYQNHEGALCLAVLHRSSSGYAYQLMSSGWKPELLYVDQEAGELVAPKDVQRHVSAISVTCTPELGALHYRKIIQYNTGSGDLDGIEDADRKKHIPMWRRAYSLAPPRHHFAGVDNLMFSLLESKGTFDSMESAVGEILQREVMRGDIDLSGIDAHAFATAINSRASFLVMERETKPKILQLTEMRSRLLGSESQLGRLKSVATRKQTLLGEEYALTRDAMETSRLQELEAQEATQEQVEKIQERLGIARGSAKEQLERVQQVEKKRDTYEAEGMPGLLAEVDDLPKLQEEQESKNLQFQAITSQGTDIKSRFSEMERVVRDSITERRERRRAEADTKARDVQKSLDDHNAQTKAAAQRANKAHLEELAVREAELSDLEIANIKAAGELGFLQRQKFLPETIEQLDVEQEALERLYGLQEDNRKALREHEAVFQQIAEEQQALAQEVSSLTSQRETAADEKAKLDALLNAADGTLLFFLRKNVPGWEDNIAKVIAPDLLMRDDLAPALGGDPDAFFGIQIDTLGIETVEAFDLEALESQIAALNLQLEGLDTAEQALASRSSALQKRRKNHGQAKADLLTAQSKHEEDVAARRQRIETLRDEDGEKRDAAIAQADAEKQKVEEQLRLNKEAIRELKSEYARHALELESIASQARMDLEAQRSEVAASAAAALARLDDELSGEVLRLKEERLSALRGAGVDAGIVLRLEADISELDRKIKLLRGKLPEIQEYKVWLETTLPQLPEREARYAEADQLCLRIARELESLNNLSAQRVQEHKTKQSELSSLYTKLGNQLQALRQTLDRLTSMDAVEVGLESLEKLSAADMEAETSRLIREADQIKNGGRKLFREVEEPFNSDHRGTPEADVIQDIAIRSRNADATGDRFWVLATPDLQMYIDDGHDAQRSKLITRVRALCTQVVESRKALQDIHKAIQDIGRRATHKVAEVLGWFPEFTNFNLHVQSKIQEMTIWDDISALSVQAERWKGMEANSLPPDGLAYALRMMHKRMSDGWVSARLEDCFSTSLTWAVNGMPRVARNTSELGDGLSTGQLKIVVGMIYLALFEMIRRDADFDLLVPIDEALELEVNNAATLVNNFNSRNVKLLLGFPGGAPELMKHFKNLYALDRRKSGAVFLKEYRGSEDGGIASLNAGLPLEEEVAV